MHLVKVAADPNHEAFLDPEVAPNQEAPQSLIAPQKRRLLTKTRGFLLLDYAKLLINCELSSNLWISLVIGSRSYAI